MKMNTIFFRLPAHLLKQSQFCAANKFLGTTPESSQKVHLKIFVQGQSTSLSISMHGNVIVTFRKRFVVLKSHGPID